MEYIISNVSLPETIKVAENLWVKGNFINKDDNLYLLEGYIIDRRIDNIEEYCAKGLKNNYAEGAYNIIYINKKENKIEIKTDKRTTIPLYYFKNGNKFAFSNNAWYLLKYFYSEIDLNKDSFYSGLIYFNDTHSTRTLFTNISRVDTASYISIDLMNNKWNYEIYYKYKYNPNYEYQLKDFIEIADDNFNFYFKKIKEQNKGKKAGFGCSGGLDSRLIGHYLKKNNIETSTYVFAERKPLFILNSTTAKTSNLIASYLGYNLKFIDYDVNTILDSMLLDIRNAPFLFSQAYINNFKQIPTDIDYILSGQPGGLAYLPEDIISNNINDLKIHADYFLGLRQHSISSHIHNTRKISQHLHLPFNPKNENGFIGLRKSLIYNIFNDKIIKDCQNDFFDYIDNNIKGNNNVEGWIRIHDLITCKYQYSGGYDSISHTKRSYFFYYPFSDYLFSIMPEHFLIGKKFLKEFIHHVNPKLAQIPDQNLGKIGKRPNPFKKVLNYAEYALRGRGLNYLNLLKTQHHQQFVQEILERHNPLFYSLIDKNKLYKSGIMSTYAGIQYLKMKMLLDIYYYKEFDILLNRHEYEKPSW